MTTAHHHDHGQAHDHHHGHGRGEDGFNAESLRNNDLLYRDVYRVVLDWLDAPPGASAMEAGCGAGGFTEILADAVVPHGGTVVAFDEAHEMLDATRELIESGPHAASVTYERGDIGAMPFADGAFDLVWSSRTVHHLADQLAGVRELARTVRTGGKLALREGSIRTRFLPDDIGIGEPGLEDRLDVAFHRWFTAGVRAGGVRYPFGWTQMLRDAGLTEVTARTFMLEALPPFTDSQIAYMGRHLRRWVDNDDRRTLLDDGDADVLTSLLDPASTHYVFKRPDLYLREMVTVYVGTAP